MGRRQKKTEAYVRDNKFPGIVGLAGIVVCSRNTLGQAIANSELLQAAKREHDQARKAKKKTSPPTVGLTEELEATMPSDGPGPEDQAEIRLLAKKKSPPELIADIIRYQKTAYATQRQATCPPTPSHGWMG